MPVRMSRLLPALLLSCGLASTGGVPAAGLPLPAVVTIPAGAVVIGSDAAEREQAYRLDALAYGHDVTREQEWYAAESPREQHVTAAYAMTVTPVTNRQYAAFVAATGHRAPDVDAATWAALGLAQPYALTRRHAWRDGRPPSGREEHPVVLVSRADADAYAAWLSARSGVTWRLPNETEWEKAVRGSDGRLFPWGDRYDPLRLNNHDAGPYDTLPVGSYPNGAGPYGLLDGAGQVFEWTASSAGPGHSIVKGGSWDDRGCGVCRPAARHGRPDELRHTLIGFRLLREGVTR